MSADHLQREDHPDSVAEITAEMGRAVEAEKCHPCGCFRQALVELSGVLDSLPQKEQGSLQPVLDAGLRLVAEEEYDCLGCDPCWPAGALNLAGDRFPQLDLAGASCCTVMPRRRTLWPPLPGDYQVIDSAGHLAVCVLDSEPLLHRFVAEPPVSLAIVGTLRTENLGIERIITNVLANPNLGTLLLCGVDSRQRVGHMPGRSMLRLMENGIDEGGRIIDAPGRRPVLRNLEAETVARFRREIQVIDRVGVERFERLIEALQAAPDGGRTRGSVAPAQPETEHRASPSCSALELDPKGYFVVFPDRARGLLRLEHYDNDGLLTRVFTDEKAAALCEAALSADLVSRLDHAAYLGRELTRAEHALVSGEHYVQESAPEPPRPTGCGCDQEEEC